MNDVEILEAINTISVSTAQHQRYKEVTYFSNGTDEKTLKYIVFDCVKCKLISLKLE